MSGPKIVDIRVLQAIQERQRRLLEQRQKQLQAQWRNQRKLLERSLKDLQPLANSEVIVAMEQSMTAMEQSMTAMDRRFEKIQETDSLEDLQRRGEQQLQFMAVPIRKVVRSGCLNCAPKCSLHQLEP
jgi:small-conductance mechanosensitive channel